MKFISYAQNFEDVLLWRALGHVNNGFYIDAGANHPVDHSVTKAFYDAGWNGINIEPLPALHQAFVAQRPRDINLAVAAGAAEGSLTVFDFPAVNGWATPDRAVAEAHRADGYAVEEITVPVRTLAAICAEHAGGEIHFLKIDVEGFEGEVLRGMDFQRWRPWLLVIEATMPNSRVTNHDTWEHLVTESGYHYAWFDGLNRYYVAQEHRELMAALTVPPNVFDNFISHHLAHAWAERKILQAEQQAMRAEHLAALEAEQVKAESLELSLATAQVNAERMAVWSRELEQNLNAMLLSTSWRVTRPLRLLGRLAQLAKRGALTRTLLSRFTANERMRRLIIPFLLRTPWLARRVSATLAGIKHGKVAPGTPEAQLPDHVRALPASARHILADLKKSRRRSTGN
jgi:FkbM family methyltransferase